MPSHYDLLVIGSGTAAVGAATQMREAGWTVAVVDFRPFGGTCALRGCDPKKMLIAGAEAVDHVRRMQGKGVVGDSKVDWSDLMAFKRTSTDPGLCRNSAMRPSIAARPTRSESQRVELVRCRRGSVFDSAELVFADHVHDLDSGEQDSGAAKGLESEHRPRDPFDGPMV